MSATWVLKLPQVDLPKEPILLHVTQKQGLDLDFLATDGDRVYQGRLRERNHVKHKAGNYDGTDEQWTAIMRYVFISRRDSGIEDDQRRNLEVACTISGKSSSSTLSISLRTRIEDITHRLGAIDLSQTDDTDDVDLFGWACQVVDTRDALEEQSIKDTSQTQDLQHTISTLQKELELLIKAKAEHENHMLAKMTLLLNEKKLKIRNQQRILATAKIDARKLAELQLSIDGDQINKVSAGRRGKGGKVRPAPEEEDESDGYEAMDVDSRGRAPDGSDESQAGDTATDSDEPDLDVSTGQEMADSKRTSEPPREQSPPPPPRTLPFQKKTATGKKAAAPPVEADPSEDTASEDDEL